MRITDNHKKPDKHSKAEISDKQGKPGNTIHANISYSEAGMQMAKIKQGSISSCSNKLMISDHHGNTEIAAIHNDAYTEAGTAKSQ